MTQSIDNIRNYGYREEEELFFKDEGKFITIASPKGVIFQLDKTSENFLEQLTEVVSLNLKGFNTKDIYILNGLNSGVKYHYLEKWWGILGEALINLDYKNRPTNVCFPRYSTEEFNKGELKKIKELFQKGIPIFNINSLEVIKELLKKPMEKLKLTSILHWSYIDELNKGRIDVEAFLSLNRDKVLRSLKYHKQLKEAEHYDELFDIPYDEYWEYFNEFIIRSPDTYDSLVEEGKNMRNCMGDYPDHVSSEDVKIFFMRKINEYGEEVPYIDIEVNCDGYVTQVMRKFNKAPSCEELEVVESWILESEHALGIDEDHFNEHEGYVAPENQELMDMEEFEE